MTRHIVQIICTLLLSVTLISCNGGDKFVGTWEGLAGDIVFIHKSEGGRYSVNGTPLRDEMLLKYKGGALIDGEREIVIYKPDHDQIFVNGVTLSREKAESKATAPVDDTLAAP